MLPQVIFLFAVTQTTHARNNRGLRLSRSSFFSRFRGSGMRGCAILRVGFWRHRAAVIVLSALAIASWNSKALAVAPDHSVIKVANGNNSASVDNGWVIFKPPSVAPSIRRFVLDGSGNFSPSGPIKLKTNGLGVNNAGLLFDVGGIVFAPCPVVGNPSRCAQSDLGTTGVGLGFGMLSFGGLGSGAGGWVTDAQVKAQATNLDQNTGSIGAVAADPVNGAYAVGRDMNTGSFTNHAIIMTLNGANGSYKVLSQTDLGTLGGTTSELLGVNKNATYAVGDADDADGKKHAVYTPTNGTALTDLSTGFPAEVTQSKAVAVNDSGKVVGTATVKRLVGGTNKSVNIGFIYDIGTTNTVFFEAPGADVVPLNILPDGRVVGNLAFLGTGPVKVQHPFMYDGALHDYGVMTLASTSQPAFGCRVNKPNNLGELVGTCIPDNTTQYSIEAGFAFYLDSNAGSPAFIDLNTALHANANGPIPSIKKYIFATATSIDDQHEVTLNSRKTGSGGGAPTVVWLTSKQAYNP
jgi:hypothetical protein